LEMEYQRGILAMQIEQAKVRQEERKKPRRKIPKAGCYPSGFSAFTSERVVCTISLCELRKDLVTMASASDPESMRSGYFNACVSHQGIHISSIRNCRQKTPFQECVSPNYDADECCQLTNENISSSLGKRSSNQRNLTKRVKCG
jgi:hypothetical protein